MSQTKKLGSSDFPPTRQIEITLEEYIQIQNTTPNHIYKDHV